MSNFWANYPSYKEDLDKVQDIMHDTLISKESYLNETLGAMINKRGKMIRPGLLLISSKFGKKQEDKKEEILQLAAIIEMFHMATLVHDDIIDESETRRGEYTLQYKYGKKYAVYIGDYIFTKCFSMLSGSYEMDTMKNISNVISRICTGELMQFHSRYDLNTSYKKYLKVISGKTAALISLACYIGAYESGADEKTSKLLGKIGYYLGVAFQIKDDILDITEDDKGLKKTSQIDILNGYYTLPVIFALQKDEAGVLKDLLKKEDKTKEDIVLIFNFIKEHKGIEKSEAIATRHTNKVLSLINKLDNIEHKDILIKLVENLLYRKN